MLPFSVCQDMDEIGGWKVEEENCSKDNTNTIRWIKWRVGKNMSNGIKDKIKIVSLNKLDKIK